MAPLKKGLDYFPLAHDIFDDENFVEVQNKYGPLGEVIFFRLLSLIFLNGYYYRFDSMDKLANKLIKSIGNRWARDKKTVIDIILFLAENNLFSSELMRENVITSRDVQLRYLKAMERRQSRIVEYNLLEKENVQEGLESAPKNTDNVTISEDNATISEDNAAISPQKIKEKENNIKEGKAASPPSPQNIRDFLVDEYGSDVVADYERRLDSWAAKKSGAFHGDRYATIRKWIEKDGVPRRPKDADYYEPLWDDWEE